jgi:hypothetical protein
MNAKKIIFRAIIGLVIVALLAGALYFLSRPEKEEEKEQDITVFTSNADDICSIEIQGEDTFTLVKEEDGWVMQGMEDVPLMSNLPETLASSLANITSPMLVEQKSTDLSKYSLDEPKVTIKLVFPDDEETFIIGDESGDYYYFRLASSNDVYIVSYDSLYLAMNGKMGFLSKTVFSVDDESVTALSYKDIVLERDGDDWMEKSPYNMEADANSVETMILSQISSVVATDILQEAKLPETDAVVSVSTSEGETKLTVTKAQDGYRFVTRSDSKYIYRVSAASMSFLDLSGFDIMSLYIAPIDITEVSSVEFVSPEKTTTLSIEAPSSEAPVFYKDSEEADETNFRDFYQTLVSLQFKGEGKASGSAEYKIIFTKEDGSVKTIEFVSMNDSDFAVVIDNESNFTVSKKSVTDLFGYLDKVKTIK